MFERVSRITIFLSALARMTWPNLSAAQITPELIEAAKKEGEMMFYGAITINSSKAIGDAFEKKYGIKLRHWRRDATELSGGVMECWVSEMTHHSTTPVLHHPKRPEVFYV